MSQLAYKFKGAGHEEPERKRKYTSDIRLQEAFSKYLDNVIVDGVGERYILALKLTRNIKASVEEVDALLVGYQGHRNFEQAGFFASAIFNSIPDKKIVFDVKLEELVDGLCYELPKGKTFVNKANVGTIGFHSEGMIINEGEASEIALPKGPSINYGTIDFIEVGPDVKGPAINYGNVSRIGSTTEPFSNASLLNYGRIELFGDDYSSLIINMGTAEHMAKGAQKSSVAINYGKTGENFGSGAHGIVLAAKNPDSFGAKVNARLAWTQEDINEVKPLKKYLEELREKLEPGRKDHNQALAVLEKYTCTNVRKDIEKIVRGAGYEI